MTRRRWASAFALSVMGALLVAAPFDHAVSTGFGGDAQAGRPAPELYPARAAMAGSFPFTPQVPMVKLTSDSSALDVTPHPLHGFMPLQSFDPSRSAIGAANFTQVKFQLASDEPGR